MSSQKKFQFSNVFTLSAAHLIHDIYSSFLAPILPVLIEKLAMSKGLAGLLSVIQRVPSLFNPLIGILAEKMRIRFLVIFAPAVTTIAMSMIGIAPVYIVLAVLLFVTGISSTLFHVPAPVMIKQVSGLRLGKGMSYFMLGGELARTLGPLIIVAVVETWGLQGSLRLIPFGIIASIVLYFKLKDIEIRKDFKKNTPAIVYKSTFLKFLPVFINLAGITLFRAGMKAALTLYLPLYLTEKDSSLWFAGISLSLLQLAGAGGTYLSGTISDRIGRRTTLVIITIVSPILMWIFISMEATKTLPLLILIGLFLVAPTSVNLAIVHEMDTRYTAFVNSIYMTINFVMSSLMLLLVGVSWDLIGPDLTYKISAGLAFIAIFFAMRVPGKVRQGYEMAEP